MSFLSRPARWTSNSLIVTADNRGSAGWPTRIIVLASACDSGVSKESRPRSIKPAMQTAVTALDRLATGTAAPTASWPIAASRTARPPWTTASPPVLRRCSAIQARHACSMPSTVWACARPTAPASRTRIRMAREDRNARMTGCRHVWHRPRAGTAEKIRERRHPVGGRCRSPSRWPPNAGARAAQHDGLSLADRHRAEFGQPFAVLQAMFCCIWH